MKITLIDGSQEGYRQEDFTVELASCLINAGHHVTLFKSSKMKVNYCNGCWSCWWKTPGECPQHDDMIEVYKSYIDSDLVLHFSPIVAGFITSKLKTLNDRSIPLVHPYIRLVNNECHHLGRYESYPKFALIVDPMDADEDDLSITKDLYKRLALNLKSELSLFTTTQKSKEEITNEISHI